MKKNISSFFKNNISIFLGWKPPKILVFTILLIFVLFISLIGFVLDNDFWFLINLGKHILKSGFTKVEPFTIHSDLNFIIQQWLTDVIFYGIYNKFGVYGMMIFLLIISSLILYLTYKICMLISKDNIKMSMFITIVINFLLHKLFITTRPQIFDILLLLLELYILELYINKNNKLYLILLPIISLLVINLHSSMWFMIFIFLLPYYAEKILMKSEYRLKPIIIATIIMMIVGLINPYGIGSIKYLFSSYGVKEINVFINEMLPLTITNDFGYFLIIFFVLFTYYLNKGNNKLRYLLLFLGTCYLGLSHYKGVLFFLVAIVLSLSHNLKNIFEEQGIQGKFYSFKSLNYIISFFIICCFGSFVFCIYDIDLNSHSKPNLYYIANYLDENTTKDIKLYTGYNDGAYLEYRGYKCYIDPRAEVFLKSNNKKEDIFIEFYNLQKHNIKINEFLNKYNFDYLVVNSDDVLYDYLESSNDYIKIYEKKFEKDEREEYRVYKRK